MTFQESLCKFKTYVDNIYIFQMCFFSISNVHHSFSKLEMILILMLKRFFFEINFFKIFYNTFKFLWPKYAFGPNNYEI